MILITGARTSGKKTYAKSLGYTDADMSRDPFSDKPVIYDVQDYVFSHPGEDVFGALIDKAAVIINEVGSGVIPLVKSERTAREEAGRLAVRLAAEADRVVRVVCGIPTVVK